MRTLVDERFSDTGRTRRRPKPVGLRACEASGSLNVGFWLRGQDLNLGPSGYEPDELPGCSTPRWCVLWAPGEGPERCPPSASPGLAGAFGDAARLLSRRNQGCGGCRAGLEGLAATYSSAP
jgi:hypothetical protein